MQETYEEVKKAFLKSQHCQRNWDLSREIDQADLDLIKHSLTNCPSKQNIAYYKVHMITDRDLIEEIHSYTDGFTINIEGSKSVTNSQCLANLLVVFEANDPFQNKQNMYRNTQLANGLHGNVNSEDTNVLKRDQHMAIGIAAGYANLTASMIGMNTGCCACFTENKVKNAIGANGEILLLMGIGFKDQTRSRREHHENNFVFPTKKKQEIQVVTH